MTFDFINESSDLKNLSCLVPVLLSWNAQVVPQKNKLLFFSVFHHEQQGKTPAQVVCTANK
ncbi:MAG: hypothetical protein CSB34_04560 [Desulfobulbus propionicus]|nr:MAG: hypothetical protein CSB34_04560 [Desulfobulbus propionicus]